MTLFFLTIHSVKYHCISGINVPESQISVHPDLRLAVLAYMKIFFLFSGACWFSY